MNTFIITNPKTSLSKNLRIADCPIHIIEKLFYRYDKAGYEIDMVKD